MGVLPETALDFHCRQTNSKGYGQFIARACARACSEYGKAKEPINVEALIPLKMKVDTGELIVYHALCWVDLVRV
jgi:hypothetical protein